MCSVREQRKWNSENRSLSKLVLSSQTNIPWHRQPAFHSIFNVTILCISLRQRPWRLNKRSGTPAFAAAEAPPDLRLWRPKRFGSKPNAANFCSTMRSSPSLSASLALSTAGGVAMRQSDAAAIFSRTSSLKRNCFSCPLFLNEGAFSSLMRFTSRSFAASLSSTSSLFIYCIWSWIPAIAVRRRPNSAFVTGAASSSEPDMTKQWQV